MVKSVSKKQMIMNFSTPPSLSDLQVLAEDIVENVPAQLSDITEKLQIIVEDFANAGLLEDLELEDEFELLLFYTAGQGTKERVVRKDAQDTQTLTLFRRPILDMWCDTEEDLTVLLRHLIVTEISESHGFEADEDEDSFAA